MTLIQRVLSWFRRAPAPPVVTMVPTPVQAQVQRHGSARGRVERATVRPMGASRL